jgi:hypothetical protein
VGGLTTLASNRQVASGSSANRLSDPERIALGEVELNPSQKGPRAVRYGSHTIASQRVSAA